MHSLSVAEQQIVQIAAAVAEGARVIVFDEPSSSLGESEARALYALIGSLKARGVTPLYVSHRMPEIFALCDHITVLRDGQHVITRPSNEIDEAQLVQYMIGRKLEQLYPAHVSIERGAELLRVENLSSPGKFRGVSFSVHAGEVVGLAGLVGGDARKSRRRCSDSIRARLATFSCAASAPTFARPATQFAPALDLFPKTEKFRDSCSACA